MMRIRLAYVEHSQVFRLEWQHAADFFTNEGKEDGVKSFIEKLTEFRAVRLIQVLRRKGCDTFRKLEEAVRDLVPQYELLFNQTAQFMDENPGMQAESILDIMDSFVRYTLHTLCLEPR